MYVLLRVCIITLHLNLYRFDCMASSTREPNWLELPREVTMNILLRLGVFEILRSARNVCPLWWDICKDPTMWRTIDLSNLGILDHEYCLMEICRYAVAQSCGHLEDITIEHFGTDVLLRCIADR